MVMLRAADFIRRGTGLGVLFNGSVMAGLPGSSLCRRGVTIFPIVFLTFRAAAILEGMRCNQLLVTWEGERELDGSSRLLFYMLPVC